VQGNIVITRYGQGWRGLKPKHAQEHGAVAGEDDQAGVYHSKYDSFDH